MAEKTYSDRVIVLKKTKLGESDLILTMLAHDGRQLRAVAKGARKPTSLFASRLELYATADVLCAQGRSLDIVKEVRLRDAHAALRNDLDVSMCAAPIAELAAAVSQVDMPEPKVFDLMDAAFSALDQCGFENALAICAATLWKMLAFSGFRPTFHRCASCGQLLQMQSAQRTVDFSVTEGGVLCAVCAPGADATHEPDEVVACANDLLYARLSDIPAMGVQPSLAFPVLCLAQSWIREYVGKPLKSITFLLSVAP